MKKNLLLYFSLLLLFKANINSQGFEKSINDSWQIIASQNIKVEGKELSGKEFIPKNWMSTNIPTTVLGALVNKGIYKDVFIGKNLELIPKKDFNQSWWFRKEFNLTKEEILKNPSLLFEGIVYSANIWINGQKIADKNEIKGSFRRFKLFIKDYISQGKNVLAVEVFPPIPGDYNIGFVDWNPRPQDQSMGLWRGVKLLFNNGIEIDNPYVRSIFSKNDYSKTDLEISFDLINYSEYEQIANIKTVVGNSTITKKVFLKGNESKRIILNSSEFSSLKIVNPKLWWPNNMGEPNLYNLDIQVKSNGKVSDEEKVTFGIREVKDTLNGNGHKLYFINGKPFVIKGGGWVDDMFLTEDDKKLETQIKYAKHMNLNTIRLEGFWGNSSRLYDLCDKHGILLMVGWSCQWEWDGYLGKKTDPEFGGITEKEDIEFVAKYFEDHVKWLRNHPSILLWSFASDLLPHPELEKKYLATLNENDPSRPFLLSAQMKTSAISGVSGAKMYGPYEYVPPVYWYVDTKAGGAYGFNTETGPGAQIPPLESLMKMLPNDKLWPINDNWDYHCARNEFNNLNYFLNAFNKRYGPEKELVPFVNKAQIMMYEAIRPMFEAFQVNKFTSSGVIQWMLNSSWPKMFWQLYDYYLMPNSAFYGTKKACEPINIIYNYGSNSIHLVNDKLQPLDGLKAVIRIFDINSKEVLNKNIILKIDANSSQKIFDLSSISNLSNVYFLDLKLYKKEKLMASNFYWLSNKADVMDFEKTDWFVTPQKEYGDFTLLNTLQKVKITYNYKFTTGTDKEVVVTIKNPSKSIAFFINVNLKKEKSDSSVLPVYWDDNYFSLLPGEVKIIKGKFSAEDLVNENAKIVLDGWNTIIN